jgi:hypothetical protein
VVAVLAASLFGMPGDEDADTMRAVQSSIAGGVNGNAVQAGDSDVTIE